MCLGIPGQIVEISDPSRLRAYVDLQGVRRDVSVALIGVDEPEGAQVGDWVLVHLGYALAKIDEAEAEATLDDLAALTAMYEHALTDDPAERERIGEDATPAATVP